MDVSAKDPQSRDFWASLAMQVIVKSKHVSCLNFSQVFSVRRRPHEFLNTWSCGGLISESCFQASEFGWRTHEKSLQAKAKHLALCVCLAFPRLSFFSLRTLPSMFGGCDEDDIVSMTQDLALSEGYDVAVFVQVKGLELGTSASGLTL